MTGNYAMDLFLTILLSLLLLILLIGIVGCCYYKYKIYRIEHPNEKEIKRREEANKKYEIEFQDWLNSMRDSKYVCMDCKKHMKDVTIATYGEYSLTHRYICPKCHKVYEWDLRDYGKVALYSDDMRSASAYGL